MGQSATANEAQTKQAVCPCGTEHTVSLYASSTAKCLGCRRADTFVRPIDESLDEEVLTDKHETKRVPCRHCGRPCVVTQFASAKKVACTTCRAMVPTSAQTRGDDGIAKIASTSGASGVPDHASLVAAISKPALPFWPTGSEKDRAELVELYLAMDEAQEDAKLLIGAKDLDDKAEQMEAARARVREAREVLKEHRSAMVTRLLRENEPNPYMEDRDEHTSAAERVSSQRYLERLHGGLQR
jgi:hypothetical protein